MDWPFKEYILTDDRHRVDVKKVHQLLSSTYWAEGRSMEQVENSLQFSLCFSIFKDKDLVGFGRVVTDHVLFAWIADIVIDPVNRGEGLGKFMMSVITEHPDIPQHMQLLRTKDAHGLYEKFGFVADECMIRRGTNCF
jgi:GNAT superfamily N-acetyltransferase